MKTEVTMDDIKIINLIGKPYTIKNKKELKYGGSVDSKGIIRCVVLSNGLIIDEVKDEDKSNTTLV